MCRWTATTVSKLQMEALSANVLRQECNGMLRACFGCWRTLPEAAALHAHTADSLFTHVVCVDPISAALRSTAELHELFARAHGWLSGGGKLTLLLLTIPETTSSCADEGHAYNCVSSALMPGVEWPTEAHAHAAAGAAGLQQCAGGAPGLCAQQLSGHLAATLRQRQQQLAANWRHAREHGAPDAALRRCGKGTDELPCCWVWP